MNIFLTGINGQLGYDVAKELIKRKQNIISCGTKKYNITDLDIPYLQLDITKKEEVISNIIATQPDIIIHCAAWTNVDKAELFENRQIVYDINAIGTLNLVIAANMIGAKFLYISTDYVFDGIGQKPWLPNNISFNPLNIYGKTKLQGELFVKSFIKEYFIIRTSWLFGKNGNNFINTMIKLSQINDTIKVVNDQIGRPTYSYDLAQFICDLIETDKYGYYHVTNEGKYISWYDFCIEIFNQYKKVKPQIISVSTNEYGLNIAKRPKNSRLDTSKILQNGFNLLPNWENSLEKYLWENLK